VGSRLVDDILLNYFDTLKPLILYFGLKERTVSFAMLGQKHRH
jgi:hypothetical protein